MNQFALNYHSIKNRLASLIKNLEFKNLFSVLPVHLFILIFLGLLYLFRFELGKFKMIVAALWWNVTQLPRLLLKRKKIQKLRVVSDAEIFKLVGKKWPLVQMFSHFKRVEANF